MSTSPPPTAVVAPQPRDEENEFTTIRHVYEPHKAGLPKIRPYLRELWRRRHFAFELAHTDMRAAQTSTFFGQAWLIINPLLLALVYLLLVDVVGGHTQGVWYFYHLLVGLFLFYFISGSMLTGANSVVAEGGLIMNIAFPRLLLPLSSVYVAFRRFLPTLVILIPFHIAAHAPTTLNLLWLIPIFAEIVLFAAGLACLFSAIQVYFRDLTQFLPYFTRIWLYVSPVIFTVKQIQDKPALASLEWFNPLMPLLGNWGQVAAGFPVCKPGGGKAPSCKVLSHISAQGPSFHFLAAGLGWAVVVFLFGAMYFMSRERDFAVRL
jgi:teichoic acid transport system permease protein